MNVPRSSLRSFLASAKSNLQNAIINQQRVTLVIGNESADLDSITSAIVLAYFRSHSGTTPLTNTSVNKHTPPSHYPPLYIPVVNIPKADVKIRPELLALLPHANLEPSYLITLDDLEAEPPAGLNPSGRDELQPRLTRLVLVDHNNLAGPLADKGFGDRVVGCIDHHVDEKVVPPNTGDEPRIIQKCGSCTSLVTQYSEPVWDSLSGLASAAGRAVGGQSDAFVGSEDDPVRRTWDAQIAQLAMASVLIDTGNLGDLSKTTEVDESVVKYLEAKILQAPGGTGAHWDRTAFYEEISAAKKDLSRLTPAEILRKDYKQWPVKDKQLGISSCVQTLTWQIDKANGVDGFRDTMHRFATERKLDVFAVMAHISLEDGSHQRELLMWSLDASNNDIIDKFANKTKEQLALEPWHEKDSLEGDQPDGGKIVVWWQRNTDYSRKTVAPLIREVMGGSTSISL